MYSYSQSTGRLLQDGVYIGTGYAGTGVGKNDPEFQMVANVGPLPQGGYTIGSPFTDPRDGPLCFRLTPDPANEMFGRSGFRIHADSIASPGSASEGCMVFSHPIRAQIAASGDQALTVTG